MWFSAMVANNPGSEIAFCGCTWSLQGNLDEHVMKFNMMSQIPGGYTVLTVIHGKVVETCGGKPTHDSVDQYLYVAWKYRMLHQIQKLPGLSGSMAIGNIVNVLSVQ